MIFWKLEAAGNDFILINQEPSSIEKDLSHQIQSLSARHQGIGADGVVYCWQKQNDWHWRFFNSDASETALCGNAARALALWLDQEAQRSDVAGQQSQRGAVAAQAHRDGGTIEWTGSLGKFVAQKTLLGTYEVNWSLPDTRKQNIAEEFMRVLVILNERGLAGAYLFNVGVPHLVLLNFDQWSLEERQVYSAMLRSHASLGAEGANVTWMSIKTKEAVTFERGVENETLACGSGALACFLAYDAFQKEKGEEGISSLNLQFPGGVLSVRREGRNLWLGGPARFVFKGEIAS